MNYIVYVIKMTVQTLELIFEDVFISGNICLHFDYILTETIFNL